MNFEMWIKRQGFQPSWLVGKRVRIVKWHPIVEEGFFALVDGLKVSKISPNEIEFDNGDVLELSENSALLFDYKIQIYRDWK